MIFLFLLSNQSFLSLKIFSEHNCNGNGKANQRQQGVFLVALQRYQIVWLSFISLVFPFVYLCSLFWHNVRYVQAAWYFYMRRSTTVMYWEKTFKNVWSMCIMYNNVLIIRSPLLLSDFCLYSPGLTGVTVKYLYIKISVRRWWNEESMN